MRAVFADSNVTGAAADILVDNVGPAIILEYTGIKDVVATSTRNGSGCFT